MLTEARVLYESERIAGNNALCSAAQSPLAAQRAQIYPSSICIARAQESRGRSVEPSR